uniref:Protein kinase domain-containing protein n=1 Tax=Alexandrium catenella TaxID=2925 RepID=A0A7S1WV10_ALECA
MQMLSCVAHGTLYGLSLLDSAGIVHNDVKPDNLIWVEAPPGGQPSVRIVDFGCARLDKRLENGRNWSLAEGGAGHLGKWSPEMALRLPITHRGDVWGLAICLCELLSGRCVWRNEADTAEVVLAQALGLCDLRDGLPSTLLRRSPLDVRLLYTPPPEHFPLRRNVHGRLEVLGPSKWGLEQVVGEGWQETDRADLGDLLLRALVIDPDLRPSAAQLLESCRFASQQYAEEEAQHYGEGLQEEEEEEEEVEEAALCKEEVPLEGPMHALPQQEGEVAAA